MTIRLDFGSYNNYSVSESRISKMMEGDRKNATQMSLWERFKDLFRADKKCNAYNELFNMTHDGEGYDKLDTFNKLKKCAKPECQDLFKKELFCNDMVFCIGNERIAQTSIQKLINVSEQTLLPVMSMSEQRLFLDMLDTLREKESQNLGGRPSGIRNSASYEYCYDLLNLYRPQEAIDDAGTEWRMAGSLTTDEENLLKCLNAGSMTSFSQFSFIGYQKTATGVEFSMVNPLISFLSGTYIRNIGDGFSFTEMNSDFLNVLREGYDDYYNNKDKIDTILQKIYDQHDGKLNISYLGQNRNRLVSPVDIEYQYVMQDDSFSDGLNKSFDGIFNKWTDPNLHLSEGLWHAINDTVF